jgi:disulfide bond formation protein DsbB
MRHFKRSTDNREDMNIESAKAPAPFWPSLFLAWLIATLATAGALFLGEVMGMTPCVLCWYQRIAMFPLVVVLGVGLLDGDHRSVRYALPLAGAGLAIALYHCLVFWGVISEALVPCGKGPSCADLDLQLAGMVPIPLLSLIAFTAIVVLLWIANRKVKT